MSTATMVFLGCLIVAVLSIPWLLLGRAGGVRLHFLEYALPWVFFPLAALFVVGVEGPGDSPAWLLYYFPVPFIGSAYYLVRARLGDEVRLLVAHVASLVSVVLMLALWALFFRGLCR